jgi:hypothetical protein
MKKILNEFKCDFSKHTRMRNVLYVFVAFSIAAYCFSMWSFGSRPSFDLLDISICGIMTISIFLFVLIYGRFRFDVFFLLLFLFDFSILFSSLINGRIQYVTKSVFLLSLFAFSLYQFAQNKFNTKVILIALFIGGSAFVLYFVSVYWKALITFDFSERHGAYFDNINEVAKNFVFLGLLVEFLIFSKKKYFLIPYWAVLFYLLLQTESVSNNLSNIICQVFMAFFLTKKGKRRYVFLGLAGVTTGVVFLLQLPAFAYYSKRIADIFATLISGGKKLNDLSSALRLEYAIDAFKNFLRGPLFGNGYDFTRYHTILHQPAHNNFTELLGDYGIVGFCLFEALIIYPLFRSFKQKSGSSSLFVGLLLYIFIFQFFLITYWTKIEYLVFACSFSGVSVDIVNVVFVSVDKKGLHFSVHLSQPFVIFHRASSLSNSQVSIRNISI